MKSSLQTFCAVLTLLFVTWGKTNAGIVITIEQVGADVVATTPGGNLDLQNLTLFFTTSNHRRPQTSAT